MIIPKIEVRNLVKNFGEKKVLDGVSFVVNKGESLAIIGGSGSGKSVCIKIIATLISPTSGSVKINGKDILFLSKIERMNLIEKIGFLFQGGALFDSLTVWENIAFRLLFFNRIEKKQAKKIAIQKLEEVGLNSKVADLFPSEISGGMVKRVAFARSIVSDPEILFFDEPTTGLDPIMSNVINNLIISKSKEENITTITITHNLRSAKKISDKVAMLHKGKIEWFGKTSEINNSDNLYLKEFLAYS